MTNNKISDGSEFIFVKVGVPHEFRKISSTCNIGITAGLEVEQYPAKWGEYCNQMTAVIVPTNFAKERLIACGTTVPIFVVPEGIDTKVFNPTTPTDVNASGIWPTLDQIPTKFNFLTVGQWLPGPVGEDRKNIPATAMAVISALLDNTDVGIVCKTFINNMSSPDRYALFERFKSAFGEKAANRVHVIHGILTDQEMQHLYVHPKIRAFLSLTHGEGYFRPLAEAMACDLPVIVTGWSGHMDYVNQELATTIGYDMTQVPPSAWQPDLLGQGQTWANPVFEEAENRIRRCYNGYKVAKDRAVKMGVIMREKWSLEAADKLLDETMDQILATSNTNSASMSERIIV
jgi:glycosyltransferase involved in cell wall biosynthesis